MDSTFFSLFGHEMPRLIRTLRALAVLATLTGSDLHVGAQPRDGDLIFQASTSLSERGDSEGHEVALLPHGRDLPPSG